MKKYNFHIVFVFIIFGFVQCNLNYHNLQNIINSKLYFSSASPLKHFDYRKVTENFNFSTNFPLHESGNVSSVLFNQKKCIKDLWHILKNIDSSWATEMLDAYGKLPSGVLLGNFLWIGKYKECISVQVSSEENDSTGFHGMYCLAKWNISMPEKIHLPMHEVPIKTGVCLPDSCHSADVRADIKYIFNFLYTLPLVKQYQGDVKITGLTCKEQYSSLTLSTILFICFLSLYLLLPATGSFITVTKMCFKHIKWTLSEPLINVSSFNLPPNSTFDTNEESSICSEREEGADDQINFIPDDSNNSTKINNSKMISILKRIEKPLKCFCIFTNGGQILDTRSSKKQFLCLHGIRFFSMTWVILGHTYIHNINYIDNCLDLLKGIDNVPFQAVIQGTFSVDTFFLIGGFLLGYLYLEEADKRNGKINWLGLCLHRFLRITPVYAFLIGFTSLVFKYLGNGPFWAEADDVITCKQYWWWNILYINNFLPIESMCLTWTWYLANDMQFFIISSLVLYVLWRWRYVGVGIFCSLLVGSWILTGYLSYIYDIPPIFMGISDVKNYTEYQGKLILAWDILYSKPYCRIGPHIIGILLAYLMYCITGKKFEMNMRTQVLGWCIATFCSASVIYGLYHVKSSSLVLHLYNAFGRSAFSLGVAWLIFCCLTGHAGLINNLLSFKLWIPLSRLTYCAYLFHPLVMNWYFQQREVPLFFTHITMVALYFAFLFMSYGVAFIISIVFEAPLINIEKFIFKR